MSQLGRIGGQVLTDNLLRAGVDLAFETNLLYFDVTNQQIGIRDATPVYTLDVNNNIYTNELTVITQLAPGNLRFNSPETISTSVGGIDVYINGGGEIFHDRLATANLVLDGNLISSVSNSNIVLDPNGSGTVQLLADTNITGDLAVTGNISLSGNLTGLGTLTFGDQTLDTVTINTDFTQSIIPGDDLTYAMGADAGDSSARRWSQAHAPDWTYITNGAWPGSGIIPLSVTISDQLTLDGTINKISAIQSNEDVLLNPDTGIIYVESVKFGKSVDLIYTLNNPNAASTASLDNFGTAVAVSGEYAIVGVPYEGARGDPFSGYAYIYNVTTGALLHTINNPNAFGNARFDYFGWSVAISDNYTIVGAPEEYDAGGAQSGKAYIFNVTTGALVHTLTNPNAYSTSAGDLFGTSVAISGNYAIVGATGEDDAGGSLSGKAYIFNVTTGALVHTLNNPNPYGTSTTDYFGNSVAISGNYAIVAAYLEDDAGGISSGYVYIYNVTTGALVHTLTNPNAYGTSVSDIFGYSVAISGNYAVVGAYQEDDAGGTDSGKAYIYNVTTGALVHTLTNPNAYGTSVSDQFGESVAISGNYAIIGVSEEDDAGGTNSGKAYIYNVTTGDLVHTLTNPNVFGTSANDRFGESVAISGNYVVVGATGEDEASASPAPGKVYIFDTSEDLSVITNQLNTPLTFASTAGIGYLRFMGDNGFVIPSGDNSQRRASPEVGETRWNTDEDYLECYDGTVWAVSTGGGIEVDVPIMEDLSHAYTLMLG
jgi:hypothetical protein